MRRVLKNINKQEGRTLVLPGKSEEKTDGCCSIGCIRNDWKGDCTGGFKRKHEVTAAVRNPESVTLEHERLHITTVDVLDPASVAAAVRGHEEVISAYGPALGQEKDLLTAAKAIVEGMQEAGLNRLLVVGGAGSLKTESGELLMDTADFLLRLDHWQRHMRKLMKFTKTQNWIIRMPVLLR